jgi:hypothetical protein
MSLIYNLTRLEILFGPANGGTEMLAGGTIWIAIYVEVEETSVLLFFNKFDVIFFYMTIFNWFIFLVAPLCWF